MLKIFLSSTFNDLVDERKAVESVIHRMSASYIGMEHFGSFTAEPLEKCIEKVNAANALVLVIADRYGYLPEGSSISMTEAEYQEARRINLPIFAYFKSKEIFFESLDPNAEMIDERLTKFKKFVESNHGVSWFSNPEDLAWKVAADLSREFKGASGATMSTEAIQNSILVSPIRNGLDELILILEQRAEIIVNRLQPFYRYAKVKDYISTFKNLHDRHIESLRNGNVILAHELLGQIHKISADLESDEFWRSHRAERPGWAYSLRPDAFQRGRMICEYVVGQLESYADEYPSYDGFSAYSWGDDKIPPTVSVRLYQKILAGNGARPAEER